MPTDPDCAGNDIFLRLIFPAAAAHLSQRDHRLHVGMIPGNLMNAGALNPVETAVPHVCHIECISLNGSRYQRCSHAGKLLALTGKGIKFLIDCLDPLSKRRDRLILTTLFDIFRHMLDQIARSKISRLMTAHSVRHDKQVGKFSHRLRAGKLSILIDLTRFSDIRQCVCFHLTAAPSFSCSLSI